MYKSKKQNKKASLRKFANNVEAAPKQVEVASRVLPPQITSEWSKVAPKINSVEDLQKLTASAGSKLESLLRKEGKQDIKRHIDKFFAKASFTQQAKALLAARKGIDEFLDAIGYVDRTQKLASWKKRSSFVVLSTVIVVVLLQYVYAIFLSKMFFENNILLTPLSKLPRFVADKAIEAKEEVVNTLKHFRLVGRVFLQRIHETGVALVDGREKAKELYLKNKSKLEDEEQEILSSQIQRERARREKIFSR